jgi:hypothetical protein
VREARHLGPIAPTPASCAQALPWLARPVFICGHHRTGTTLLLNLLDGHPELSVLPNEGTYLTMLGYAARDKVSFEDTDRFVATWIFRLVDPTFEPHFLLGRSRDQDNPSVNFARRLLGWQPALRAAWPERVQFALLLSLVSAYSDMALPGSNPRMWVEKTPLNELHAKTLIAAFPEARFIHLIRDPLVTLASILELQREGTEHRLRHIWRIARSLRLASQNRELRSDRYLVVRYEELTAKPDAVIEQVRAFLAISPSAMLATPTTRGQPVRSNSSFERGAPGIVVPPRRSSHLDEESADLVRALAGSAARVLGYDIVPLPRRRRLALLWNESWRYASGIRRRIGTARSS